MFHIVCRVCGDFRGTASAQWARLHGKDCLGQARRDCGEVTRKGDLCGRAVTFTINGRDLCQIHAMSEMRKGS